MAEKLTDVELESVALHHTTPRSMSKASAISFTQEDDIETACGLIHVEVQGDRSKPAILTYHDIGLNSQTCFGGFFNHEDMQPILKHFSVYHVNAPGQQEGALPLPQGLGFTGDQNLMKTYTYPTMDQLSEMILPVMQYYGLKRFIGFGAGAGANVLARFALEHADKIDALLMLNGTAGKAGWTEWGYQKVNSWYLKSGQLSTTTEEYLLWHWFGKRTMSMNHDLVLCYSDYIKSINPQNLAYFIDSYVKRTDLNIKREIGVAKPERNFSCPTMLVAGESSAHLDDTITMNSRMDPNNCQWMKFECGGMVMEEAPNKLIEAFRLFLQGMGYAISLGIGGTKSC